MDAFRTTAANSTVVANNTSPSGSSLKSIQLRSRGRVPKWCSPTCRNKAWQANHAPSEGPVRVVQQTVHVGSVVHEISEPRDTQEWVEMVELLAKRPLAQGRIYRRDLPALAPAISHLVDVTRRRLDEH